MEFLNLEIDSAKWLEMYNLDFTPYLEKIVKFNKKMEKEIITYHVPWAYVQVIMKQHYPTYEVRFEKNIHTGEFYHIDNTEAHIFAKFTDLLSKNFLSCGHNLEDISNSGTTMGLKEFVVDRHFSVTNSLNTYLLPYIYDVATKARTNTLYFPIMDYRYSSVQGVPDSTILNRNMMRAMVKAVAYFLGFGLRAWTTEDIGEDSPKMKWFERLRILDQEYYKLTNRHHELFGADCIAINFGKTVVELSELGKIVGNDIKELLLERINDLRKLLIKNKSTSKLLEIECNFSMNLSDMKKLYEQLELEVKKQ